MSLQAAAQLSCVVHAVHMMQRSTVSRAYLCSLSLALAGVTGSGAGSGSVKRSSSSLSSAASGSEPYSDDGGSAIRRAR